MILYCTLLENGILFQLLVRKLQYQGWKNKPQRFFFITHVGKVFWSLELDLLQSHMPEKVSLQGPEDFFGKGKCKRSSLKCHKTFPTWTREDRAKPSTSCCNMTIMPGCMPASTGPQQKKHFQLQRGQRQKHRRKPTEVQQHGCQKKIAWTKSRTRQKWRNGRVSRVPYCIWLSGGKPRRQKIPKAQYIVEKVSDFPAPGWKNRQSFLQRRAFGSSSHCLGNGIYHQAL